ncbi:MAG: hypothetical protein IJV06_12615 [Bacteroidaceae bacterium]|nr:hypothetical protein [Bacteroidaceae bacterium]MBQ9642373.1 hypothetical protein [Bacteroidaceae bacterium]
MKPLYNTLWAVLLSALSAVPVNAQKQRVEYFWDTDPGIGRGQVLQRLTSSADTITTELDVSGLTAGIHKLGLRALNDTLRSATYYRQFYVPAKEEKIVRVEYAWDKAPTLGKGSTLSFTEGSVIDMTKSLSVKSLSAGMHTFYIRALSTNHHSATYTRSFYVAPTPHAVEAIEYYFDTDPGIGQATRMSAAIEGDSLNMAFDVETDGLSDGVHHIGIRTLTDGTWSATKVRQFLVRRMVENYITRVEYFWNTDPGQGNGIAVDIVPGQEVNVDFEADMTELPAGPHTLGLRAQSGSLGWSTASLTTGTEFEGWDVLQDYLNSLTDTEDALTTSKYTRQFRNRDWQAFYVPFTLKYSDWSAHFDVARINAFYQYDDDEDGVVDRQVLEAIIVRPQNGTLKANYPYLIRAKSKDTFSFNTGTQQPQEINSVSCSTVEARYTFTGNYTDMKGLKSAGLYRLRGGSLSIPDSDDEVLPPYRWYLSIDDLGNQLDPAAGAKIRVKVVGDETATGIDDVLIADEDELVGNRKVYDLAGRRVNISADAPLNSLPRGIYIINNKKYINK